MNHNQYVWIQFESLQDNEVVKEQFPGKWIKKGNAFYITYEQQDESGIIRNRLRYEPGELKVIRNGALQSEQIYRLYEHRRGYFNNGLVKLDLYAYTYQLTIKDLEGKPVIGLPSKLPFLLLWEYELFVGEQSTGRFKLRLLLKEATNL